MIKKLFTSIYARYATLLVLALLSANYALGEPKTVKYMQNSTTAASIPTDGGTAPAGSSIEFKNTYGTKEQLTKDNSMTYTLKGYEGCIIKSLSMSMHSNKSAGTGKFSLVAGSTTLAEIASNTGFNQAAWYGAWSQAYVNVVPTMIKNDYVIQSGENVVLTISASANSLFCQSITITYEEVSTSVATPTITPSETDFLGSASVEISCATEGASIYYTLDETDPTNASTQYTGAINISETTTIKAIAYKGEDASSVATKTYTKIVPLATMDEIFNASATDGNYWITFNDWIVSGVKGSNAYLTDNSGKGLILYNSSHGFEAGKILNGTVKCALTRYNGSAEITNLTSSTEGLTVTEDGNLNTVETTISDLSGVNTGAYINLGALTYNGTNFTDGTNTIKPYNTFMTLPTLANGKKYYVKGIYIQYNSTKEIAPLTNADFTEVPATTYDITINPSLNGFVTVDAVGNEAQEGQIVTLTITPDTHYALSDISVTDASSNPVVLTDQKFTMPASAVTISATFAELTKYTVTYNALGAQIGTEQVYDGESIASAPTATALTGWTFVGWTTNNSYSMSKTSPAIFDLSTPITENVDFYAVYSKTEGGSGQLTAELTNKEICESGMTNSYADGSITNNYGTWNYNACKQGNVGKDGEYFIQIRSNATVSYIQVPDFSGDITSIVLKKVCNTSKTQYTGDLYFRSECSNDATALATGASSEALDDVTLNIPSGHKTGYIMSSGACRISSITVNYTSGTTYYTIYEPIKDVEISNVGWATACVPFAATVSGDVTAYYVSVEDGNLVKTPIAEGEHIVGETGVLLKSNAGSTATATFTAVELDEEKVGVAWYDNMMVGSLTDKTFSGDNKTYYILTLGNDDKVGFYWDWETNNSGASAKCPAGKAVLAVPNSSTQAKAFFSLDDEPNGIEDVRSSRLNVQSSIYNLNGVRVNGNYKGIVIIDGKKFMNK